MKWTMVLLALVASTGDSKRPLARVKKDEVVKQEASKKAEISELQLGPELGKELAMRTAENKQWMADFLRRIVADKGGNVNDEGGLNDLAAWYIGEDRTDSIDKIERDLDHASWVTYPASQKSPPAADCIFEGFWKVEEPLDNKIYIYEMRKVSDAPFSKWNVTYVAPGQEAPTTLKHDRYGSGFGVTWGPPSRLDNSGGTSRCNTERTDIEPGPVSGFSRHGWDWSLDFYLGLPKGIVVQWEPFAKETSLCPMAKIETLEGELFSMRTEPCAVGHCYDPPTTTCKHKITASRVGSEYAKTYR